MPHGKGTHLLPPKKPKSQLAAGRMKPGTPGWINTALRPNPANGAFGRVFIANLLGPWQRSNCPLNSRVVYSLLAYDNLAAPKTRRASKVLPGFPYGCADW